MAEPRGQGTEVQNLHWGPGKSRIVIIIIIIIIITNEKIKVMLSRKRCRGTLQDYNKGEISKCQSNCGRIEMSSAGV